MAFGLAQLGLAAAALGLADEAYEALPSAWPTGTGGRTWSRPTTPGALFNVDICGGFPALVVAMLVQARGNDDPAAARAARRLAERPDRAALLLRGGVRLDELAWTPDRVDVSLPERSPTPRGRARHRRPWAARATPRIHRGFA